MVFESYKFKAEEGGKEMSPYREEENIQEDLVHGTFNTSNYGDRAMSTYYRDMVIVPVQGGLEVNVGDEYIFNFDMDIVEDLVKVLQYCIEKNKEEKK